MVEESTPLREVSFLHSIPVEKKISYLDHLLEVPIVNWGYDDTRHLDYNVFSNNNITYTINFNGTEWYTSVT